MMTFCSFGISRIRSSTHCVLSISMPERSISSASLRKLRSPKKTSLGSHSVGASVSSVCVGSAVAAVSGSVVSGICTGWLHWVPSTGTAPRLHTP